MHGIPLTLEGPSWQCCFVGYELPYHPRYSNTNGAQNSTCCNPRRCPNFSVFGHIFFHSQLASNYTGPILGKNNLGWAVTFCRHHQVYPGETRLGFTINSMGITKLSIAVAFFCLHQSYVTFDFNDN